MDYPPLYYNLACAYALNGRAKEALGWLRRTLAVGFYADAARDADLDTLRTSEEFGEIVRGFASLYVPRGRADTAFTLGERGLTVENVAFDPVTGTFYAGSIYRRKIVQRHPTGDVDDFVGPADNGLYSVLGMKVDASRRRLWVATAAEMTTGGLRPGELGRSSLLALEIPSGRLLKRLDLDTVLGAHLLNDLAVDGRGEVFVSDYLTGVIYRASVSSDSLEAFVPTVPTANGITLSGDGRYLFVGTEREGIYRCDLRDRSLRRISAADTVSFFDIDGLYAVGRSLLAVQTAMNRVARFFLDSTLSRVDSVHILLSFHESFEMPTTGVVVGEEFFLVANCQYNKFTPEGRLSSLERFNDTVILRVKVGEASPDRTPRGVRQELDR